MRLVTFVAGTGKTSIGVMIEDSVHDLSSADPALPGSIRLLLEQRDGLEKAKQAIPAAVRASAVDSPRLCAPIQDPRKIICIGLNYRDHAQETGAAIPREPVVFSKFVTAINGPFDDILLPAASDEVDFEAELVVVIGRRGKDVSKGEAMSHVAGYMIGHDVSARDWQKNKDGKQWLLGKSFDTFAPVGPCFVSADEVSDPHSLAISLSLNGQVMQNSNTSQMIFRIPDLIAYVSRVATLEPGDLVFTGTPSGVGVARKPPVFLKDGDEVSVRIETLGQITNRCRSQKQAAAKD